MSDFSASKDFSIYSTTSSCCRRKFIWMEPSFSDSAFSKFILLSVMVFSDLATDSVSKASSPQAWSAFNAASAFSVAKATFSFALVILSFSGTSYLSSSLFLPMYPSMIFSIVSKSLSWSLAIAFVTGSSSSSYHSNFSYFVSAASLPWRERSYSLIA